MTNVSFVRPAPSLRASLDMALWAVLLCLLVAGALASLVTGGRDDVGLAQLAGVFAGDAASSAEQTMRDIRLPRTLAAALLGVNLGLAGLLLQAVTRNPLASPTLLGINQGAALGIVLGLTVPAFAPVPGWVLASAFGMVAAGVTFAIAGLFSGRIDTMRLILGGVAVGAIGFSAVRLGYTLDDDIARDVVRWTVGDIADLRFPAALRLVAIAGPALVMAYLLAHRLNLMAMGHAASHGLGFDPRQTLFMGTGLAALLTGISISVAGPIAFVGLVTPHLARWAGGSDHRRLVPLVAMLGAMLTMWADALSKLWPQTEEIPVGIVIAILGAPWLLVVVLRRSRHAV
ncbi:FecCD family ABC transporter permease [Mameliella alba]|uniref:FecCD family ABC transporter permease n=1 Tax=Mameliella alba TaxID=561184 RepID=UPI0017EA79A0|nr:iron ABC transporter permease [Mameliella alba]